VCAKGEADFASYCTLVVDRRQLDWSWIRPSLRPKVGCSVSGSAGSPEGMARIESPGRAVARRKHPWAVKQAGGAGPGRLQIPI
jgi:hypothetical protein